MNLHHFFSTVLRGERPWQRYYIEPCGTAANPHVLDERYGCCHRCAATPPADLLADFNKEVTN